MGNISDNMQSQTSVFPRTEQTSVLPRSVLPRIVGLTQLIGPCKYPCHCHHASPAISHCKLALQANASILSGAKSYHKTLMQSIHDSVPVPQTLT